MIDSVGVYKATKDLINELVEDLMFREYIEKTKFESPKILIDGVFPVLKLRFEHECIIKGDGRYLSIAAASVLAKTYRDDLMNDLAQEFSGYGWKTNVGYPTVEHREGIRQLGITPYHRKSFTLLPVQLELFEQER